MEPEVDEDKLMQMNLKTAGTRALKVVATIGVAGALALAVATPGQARNGRIAAAGAGFAAGAVVGAVAANSAYGPGYYEPGYNSYGSNGYDAYAYDAPAYRSYGTYPSSCATDGNYGRTDFFAC